MFEESSNKAQLYLTTQTIQTSAGGAIPISYNGTFIAAVPTTPEVFLQYFVYDETKKPFLKAFNRHDHSVYASKECTFMIISYES